jgi:pentatricopeptide repeat protein
MQQRKGVTNQQRSAHQRILVCKKDGDWQEAVNILTDMRVSGRNLGTVSYNAAIDACGKARQVGRALGLFDELVAAGNVPDAVTYTSLIDACGRASLLDQAFALFARYAALGPAPPRCAGQPPAMCFFPSLFWLEVIGAADRASVRAPADGRSC